MALPKVLYVYEDYETDGSSYYCAVVKPSGCQEGLIGSYVLQDTYQMKLQAQVKRPKTKSWIDAK